VLKEKVVHRFDSILVSTPHQQPHELRNMSAFRPTIRTIDLVNLVYMIEWGKRTVNTQLGVANNLLDLTLLLEVLQGLPGKGTVDLQAVDEDGDGDETVGLDILGELVGGGLVEDDGVVGLVLDCWRVSSCVFHRVNGWRMCDVRGGVDRFCGVRFANSPNMSKSMCWLCFRLIEALLGANVPLPLDHFFFCFLPPAAAACTVLSIWRFWHSPGRSFHTILIDVVDIG
jgi:hypothetical protein